MVSETLSQIALALENARLLEEAGWRIEREHLVSEVATRIRQTLDIEVVLQTAVRAIAESLDIPEVEVRLGNLESSS
jgi:GAF domain-containing protein